MTGVEDVDEDLATVVPLEGELDPALEKQEKGEYALLLHQQDAAPVEDATPTES
jgi:hypothetical protein